MIQKFFSICISAKYFFPLGLLAFLSLGFNSCSTVEPLKNTQVTGNKDFFVATDLKNNDFNQSSSKWCWQRSKQSDHFVVFWEAGFGADPNASTVPEAMRVNIDDLLQKAEAFFAMNVNTLKFAETGNRKSNLDKYKMQIYLIYQSEWLATGSGYDDIVGALWVNPSTCKPVGSVIAHEIGHSFQYMVYADALANGICSNDFSRGFRYGFGGNGGNGFWEQTAQWQSFQSYPREVFESYNFGEYTSNYHRHIGHEFQRYASYFIHYYWAQKHGIDFIGKLWREAKSPEDPIQAYMRMNNQSTDQMYAALYDASTRMVTWDLDAIRANGANYIGKHTYKLYSLAEGSYQVAYAKCPGTTGYNVIPLNIPAAGTVVTTAFTGLTPGSALPSGDPGQYSDNEKAATTTNYNNCSVSEAGWRYGYVALLENGQRIYGEMNRQSSANVQFTIPTGCSKLWFVVMGAPTTYRPHAWDEKESNDEQWPYKVKFNNTDLLGNLTINANDAPKDLTLTYNVNFAADATNYSGTTINLNSNGDFAKVAQALVMQPTLIQSAMLSAKSAPAEGKIAFSSVESNGTLNYNTTANGYGFWFDSAGNAISWGKDNDSRLYTEFVPANMEFTIGQYPGKSKAGDKYTLKEAFVYTKNGKQTQVTFIFNVTIK